MVANTTMQTIISADAKGIIEYWDINSFLQPGIDKGVSFKLKSETDLYDLAKCRVIPYSLAVASTGNLFAVYSNDKQIRLYDFSKGKLIRKYDESINSYSNKTAAATSSSNNNNQDGNNNSSSGMDVLELGRRQAMERELEASPDSLAQNNMVFDESGYFLIFATLKGIKIVNIVTNKVVRTVGTGESGERFLHVALYQGIPKVDNQFLLSRAGGESTMTKTVDQMQNEGAAENLADPTIFCTSFKRRRFYCFSRREPSEEVSNTGEGRDKFNELPNEDERNSGAGSAAALAAAAALQATLRVQQVILHTTIGDIVIKLQPDECPRTVENFVTHVRNGYYNNLLFHRVIKGFMIQTGDPLGNGTGGESIWGREFEDEFHKTLR